MTPTTLPEKLSALYQRQHKSSVAFLSDKDVTLFLKEQDVICRTLAKHNISQTDFINYCNQKETTNGMD